MLVRFAPFRCATAMVVVVAGLSGCASGAQEETADCESTVREAAFAAEPSQQLRLLDDALARCESLPALATEIERYPGIIGFDLSTFLTQRCTRVDDATVTGSPTCTAVAPPVETIASSGLDIVFVGTTLDGRSVEIRADADTPFIGAQPAAFQQTIDIAIELGCEGVLAERDRWAAQIADPAMRDEASVFANQAQSVANFIGCSGGFGPADGEEDDGDG